jgi:phosphoglycerol geranylgeranyltransferase
MNRLYKRPTYFELIRSLKNGVALLIDPEKENSDENLKRTITLSENCGIDLILVGGSTVTREQLGKTTSFIKKNCQLPLVIFPGSSNQITNEADAFLYLSLISGRNPDYLIGHHVRSAHELFYSNLEIIPTSYILIDGGKMTSVAYVSQTTPIPREQISIVRNTCMAGLLLGQKVLYLDAGSGAAFPIPSEMIADIAKLDAPIIVGGGIKSIESIQKAHESGANIVVIGNHVEENIDFLLDIALYKNQDFRSQEARL